MQTNRGRDTNKMPQITMSNSERREVKSSRHAAFIQRVADICREHGGKVITKDGNYAIVCLKTHEVTER